MSNQLKIIFQTRLNSSRLPGKALLDVCGFPAIILAVKRVSNCGREVIVATSTAPADDILCDALQRFNIKYVRGPLDDVMQRYVFAAQNMDDDDVIARLTGDNLLIDGTFIEKYFAAFLKSQSDYMGSAGTELDLPYGISAEFFYAGALRKIAAEDTNPHNREHVTPPFYQNKVRCIPDRKALTNLPCGMKDLRCTMDNFDDYIKICRVFKGIESPITAAWEDLCLKLQQL